jgi:hypothetical protein
MSDARTVVNGACLCGRVQFDVTLPTLFCAHCHCTMCQRNHGAAFVTWFGVPPSQLEIRKGREDLVRYDSSEHGSRSFCRHCGSSLFCENDTHPDRIDVVLANLNGEIDRKPQLHAHFDSRARWFDFDDGLVRLGGKSGVEPL